MAAELELHRVEAEGATDELLALKATWTMRFWRLARGVYRRLGTHVENLEVLGKRLATRRPPANVFYHSWLGLFDTMTAERRDYLKSRVADLTRRPLVSVILPVYDTPEPFLRQALDSVLAQVYQEWELCVVDDCSGAPWVPKVLDEYVSKDRRVRVTRRGTNGHISAASNTALEMATGEWVALLDHDDVLAEHALALAVVALDGCPGAGLLYSDEDKLDEEGRRARPFFKPDFDPLLLLSQNYVCHMTMARRDLVQAVGGFREGFEGAQDWDLVLRLSERLRRDQVVHVPNVLYHWREHRGSTALSVESKPYAVLAQHRAVEDHLSRVGKAGQVTANRADGLVRVKWSLPSPTPKISIVIPTRDGEHLATCLDSIFSGTGYPNFEVIVVDNGSVGATTRATLEKNAHWVTVIRDERPFNFSALNNSAAARCDGDALCLMNDDCEVLGYDWLEEMVSQLYQEDVGVVGAKLLYPDDRVQHAGVLLGVGGIAGHAHRMSNRHSVGHFGWLFTPRTLSAVTAACMLVRRDVFEALGGLDEEHLGISLNDVDFCLRAGEAGWRVVWTPFAVLRHHESVSRGLDAVVRPEAHGREREYMRKRWAPVLTNDPAYNPNFTLGRVGEQFALASPPRSPWWR